MIKKACQKIKMIKCANTYGHAVHNKHFNDRDLMFSIPNQIKIAASAFGII